MSVDYNNISLEYIKEVYPDFDQGALDFLNELNQKVSHLSKAGVPLEIIRYLLRYDFTADRVNAAYKKQSNSSSRFQQVADCHRRGLTAKEAALELKLSLKTIRYNYPFTWPREKTHTASGQLIP